jgi:hypothetical protein
VSAEARSGGGDPRARAARYRGRAADLRKQAQIEEAWAAELDGEVRATPTTSAPGRERAPEDVPGDDVSPPQPAEPGKHANSAKLVAAQPRLGADAALAADPPPDRRGARSGLKPCDVVVVASAARLTPDEVEAIAQRLAALLLRAPSPPRGSA